MLKARVTKRDCKCFSDQSSSSHLLERVSGGDSTEASDNELQHRFSELTSQVATILGLPPSMMQFRSIGWSEIAFTFDKPRFGVEEVVNPAKQAVLLVAKALLGRPKYLLDWVLWREAVLGFLCLSVRLVPEAADLGLYAGLKYGVKSPASREHLQRIWETISPPRFYENYSYAPTGGFALFDDAANNRFLRLAVGWLNSAFAENPVPLTTYTFTSVLERWLFEFQNPLNRVELPILAALSSQPSLSQDELAERIGLSQATTSRILRGLARNHLLRLVRALNLPAAGLQPVSVTFWSPNLHLLSELRALLARIRYIWLMSEIGPSINCTFAVPTNRTRRFRRWVVELATAWNLPRPNIRVLVEQLHHRNFTAYDCEKGGWPLDYEPVLDNVLRLIQGEWTHILPSIHSFPFSTSGTARPVQLRPEDFVYTQRATSPFFLTNRVKSTEAREARVAGFRESEHMKYRRRVEFLEDAGLLSPPLGVGLVQTGLDAVINLRIEASYERSSIVLNALQLMPHLSAFIYDDGSAAAVLPVPKKAAISVGSSLKDLLDDSGIPAATMASPAWNSYGWTTNYPIQQRNYDFERAAWVWTKDTLPEPRPPGTCQ